MASCASASAAAAAARFRAAARSRASSTARSAARTATAAGATLSAAATTPATASRARPRPRAGPRSRSGPHRSRTRSARRATRIFIVVRGDAPLALGRRSARFSARLVTTRNLEPAVVTVGLARRDRGLRNDATLLLLRQTLLRCLLLFLALPRTARCLLLALPRRLLTLVLAVRVATAVPACLLLFLAASRRLARLLVALRFALPRCVLSAAATLARLATTAGIRVGDVVLPAAPSLLLRFGRRFGEEERALCLLLVLLALEQHLLVRLPAHVLHPAPLVRLPALELFPLQLLLLPQRPFLLVDLARARHVVLGLLQQILALVRFRFRERDVVPRLVAVPRQVGEVLVRQSQLVHRLQHNAQDGFFVPQHERGQALEHERNVEQQHRVLRCDAARLQQRHLGLLQLAGAEVRPRQVLHHLDVVVAVELLQAVLVHLDRADVLLLLHVDVRDVDPHVAKVGRRLAHLGEDIARLDDAPLVRQHRADPVRRPDVLRVVPQHLLVDRERLLLVLLLLLLVAVRLVEALQPEVAERYQRVRVARRGRVLQDRLEVLLPERPLHLGEMQVAQQRARVRVFHVDLQCVLEEIGRDENQTLVARHTPEPQIAVDVVRVLLQDVLVQLVGLIEHGHGLVQAGQVVRHRDGDRIVVLGVVLRLDLRTFDRLLQLRHRFVLVAQPVVQRGHVVQYLRRYVGVYLLRENAGGRAVCLQRSRQVVLLQNLCQLDPRLHVVRELFRHLFQVILRDITLRL
uniref:Uncharacterized protein n=1 Tax=Anopheles atroparvus TaxID=41427 RepID=A0AAG5CPI8_ANOAO